MVQSLAFGLTRILYGQMMPSWRSLFFLEWAKLTGDSKYYDDAANQEFLIILVICGVGEKHLLSLLSYRQ